MEAGRCRGPGGLLDLPMRDGNDIMAYQNASGSSAFRPSYEGWKLGTEDTRSI